ncbi:hypothetical protein PSTG_15340 [Puccinia striiformis f. sp. tritici PST-78]|uniref:Uncharacterized protein n=1 Tax=Puccinia striiformis f. sp. tritici PST-78 TaxID=1165861 RepID=A0A0L0UW18_9BASI|nr:hypothetical protein PSTG_15340 [Puccinia striiformis f. sp. tritici PST-78]
MQLQVLQGIITAQLTALSTTRRIHTALANTVNIFIEEDKNAKPPVHGGSRPGRQPNLERGFEEGYQRLYRDYLAPEPIYGTNLSDGDFECIQNFPLRLSTMSLPMMFTFNGKLMLWGSSVLPCSEDCLSAPDACLWRGSRYE